MCEVQPQASRAKRRCQVRVLHYLNQFFAGFGGEGQSGFPPRVIPGPVGPGRRLETLMGQRERGLPGGGRVVATLVCGDDTFARDAEASLDALTALAREHEADVLVAGPAFNAGRYGMACMQVGAVLGQRLGLPAVTAMFPGNPGVLLQARGVFTLPTKETALGMDEALERLARFALRLARGEDIGAAEAYGFLPRGRRVNVLERKSAAVRAVELLMTQLHGHPASSEIPLPSATEWRAAARVANVATARIALVTEGGIVPRGNPDRIESRRATRWRKYPIRELDRLSPEHYECVHAGFDTRWVGADPHRVLPLDVARDLEREGRIGALHDHYYVTVGCGTTVEAAQSFGEAIARDLVAGGVKGVVMTAT